MSPHRWLILALVAAALTAAACSPGSETGATAPTPESTNATAAPASPAAAPAPSDTDARLVAHAWQLESATDPQGRSIAALFPAPDHRLGLAFRDGRVGVEGGCNRQSFAYTWLDAEQLKLEPGISTQMACPPPLDAVDAAIAGFLTGTLRASVVGAPDAPDAPRLRLSAADGSVLQLSGAPTPETRFGGPGTLEFLEVLPERGPCGEPPASERRCLMVRARHFDEHGIATGTPGEFRPLAQEIEGFTPTAGEQSVLRVQRFGPVAGTSGETAAHYVLDLVVETRVVDSAGAPLHVSYICADGRRIEAHYDNRDHEKPTARLVIDGRSFELYHVVSGSGARYGTESGLRPNHGLQWWTKGDHATLSEMLMDHTAAGPVELTTCSAVKP